MKTPADSRARTALVAFLAAVLMLAWHVWPSSGLTRIAPEKLTPFDCLSYAPFRQSDWRPDNPALIIPPQVIERDLEQIAHLSPCVRTYGTANGLDAVPSIAKRVGLRVWQGVWLGADERLNAAEMDRALQVLANDSDVIDRVIVGSEVLLRGDLPADRLNAYLRTMQNATTLPVAYADVWEFWLRHAAQIAPQVDEALIHILPYWENSPVELTQAVDHVMDVWRRAQRTLGSLPVLIGETGWPSAGRQRGAAKPGIDAQQRFVYALSQRMQSDAVQGKPVPVINVIEAFNQPWKAALEGVAGSAWGVLDQPVLSQRDLLLALLVMTTTMTFLIFRFAWSSVGYDSAAVSAADAPVTAGGRAVDADSPLIAGRRTIDADTGTAAPGVAGEPAFGQKVSRQTQNDLPPSNRLRIQMLVFATAGAVWMALLLLEPVREWMGLSLWSGGALVRLGAMVFCTVWALLELRALGCAASFATVLPFVRLSVDAPSANAVTPLSSPVSASSIGIHGLNPTTLLPIWREVGLWGVAAYTLLLVSDGRYLDLSWPLLALPLLPWSLRVWVFGSDQPRGRFAIARAGLLAGSAVAIIQVERWDNTDAVLLSLCVLVMALAPWRVQ